MLLARWVRRRPWQRRPAPIPPRILTLTMAFPPKAISPELPYSWGPAVNHHGISRSAARLAQLGAGPQAGACASVDKGNRAVCRRPPSGEAYRAIGVDLQVDYFERERVDFVPVKICALMQSSTSLEIGGNSPTTAGLLVKQARELGYKGPIDTWLLVSEMPMEPVKVAGKQAAEGVYVHLPSP